MLCWREEFIKTCRREKPAASELRGVRLTEVMRRKFEIVRQDEESQASLESKVPKTEHDEAAPSGGFWSRSARPGKSLFYWV